MTIPGPGPSRLAASFEALPPERAFVIQLLAASDGDAERFAGRAEHVASGEAARFGSIPELIAFVRHVLASEGTTPACETIRGGAR
ncbi:hypothetical protein K2Z84_31430 [Candidatus Binatia bacterium]|jgi:hypothetical protein|nr:hypothetical protein [Candidatus Binatia bacterium]